MPKSIPSKLVRSKKNYTENKPNELLLRIFPKGSVYKNPYYYKEGKKEKKTELDNLISYDNYLIFFESKSGALTEPGLRGGLLRFKDDIQDIIKEGDSQINGAIDYIQCTEMPAFYNNEGKEILKINKSNKNLKFIKIILTFVPIRGLLFDSKDIDNLSLFDKDKPLIINLFDLETVAKFLPSPSLFINYLIQRSNWINQVDVGGYLLDETPFLHDYMKAFNFKDTNQFSLLNQEKYDLFDNYHNYQDKKPNLEITANFVKFLNSLEQSKCEGFTAVCNSLIELDKVNKNEFIDKISRANKNIKNHKKSKWFSQKFENTNYGLTYMVTKDMMNHSLIDICRYASSFYQADRWYGINYVLDTASVAQIVILDEKVGPDADLKYKKNMKLES